MGLIGQTHRVDYVYVSNSNTAHDEKHKHANSYLGPKLLGQGCTEANGHSQGPGKHQIPDVIPKNYYCPSGGGVNMQRQGFVPPPPVQGEPIKKQVLAPL